MRKLVRVVVMIALLGTAGAATAATSGEFYLGLLRRGVAEFDAGRFDAAARTLRIAAFGLMDAVEYYQLAHIYLSIASDRANDAATARYAAQRVVAAERSAPRYASLALPAAVRTQFDAVAKKLLTAPEQATLAAAGTPRTMPQQPESRGNSTPVQPPPQSTPPPVKTAPAPKPASPETPRSTTTEQPKTTVPAPTPEKIAPAPEKVAPAPEKVAPAPEKTAPVVEKPAPAPQPVTPPRTTTTPPRTTTTAPPPDISASFLAADRALNAANLIEARRVYRELLTAPLTHDQFLRVFEGLYRARDFEGALQAFAKVGTLARGEEPYRYYLAVALYETSQHARAKTELKAVLPFIEITPDVARYRAKIEGAID